MAYFPMFIELKGKSCIVVGGGAVAYRKISILLQYGADVTAIAETFTEQLERMRENPRLHLLKKEIKEVCQIESFAVQNKEIALAICATNNRKLNQEIALFFKEKQVPVNVVDQKELCTFLFPAVVNKENVSIGITTEGKSPMVSSYLREQIEEFIDEELLEFLEEIGEYRAWLKEHVKEESKRRECLREKMEDWKRKRKSSHL